MKVALAVPVLPSVTATSLMVIDGTGGGGGDPSQTPSLNSTVTVVGLVVSVSASSGRPSRLKSAATRYPPLAAVVIRDSPKGDKDASGRIKTEEGVYSVADGKVRFVPIKTGLTGELDIEVESGLKDGETVISGPFKTLRTIKEGDRVREMSDEQKKAAESGGSS